MRTRMIVLVCSLVALGGCDLPFASSDARIEQGGATRAKAGATEGAPAEALAVRRSGSYPTVPAGATARVRRPMPTIVNANTAFTISPVATFNEPWAMTFLPDGRMLITLKGGTMRLFNPATLQNGAVTGIPAVYYGGQGGLGDVILHPQFAQNNIVYISYAENDAASNTRGAAVARATLATDANGGGSLNNLQVIWRQVPKVSGVGHYSHRMAFDWRGKLFITSGERQMFTPAQDMASNLGKIVRLNDDGTLPPDNPFASQGGIAAQVWTLGHRNLLGIAFDDKGRLWEHEMGPSGGDELNLIERGTNYGWPIVSNGDNYDGSNIPDHPTRPEFNAPEAWWTPVIAPAGFVIYKGSLFPWFRGNGFIGGLASQALVRIRFDGVKAREIQRYAMGRRIREVEQGPDGALWLLEDGSGARLLKLTPP